MCYIDVTLGCGATTTTGTVPFAIHAPHAKQITELFMCQNAATGELWTQIGMWTTICFLLEHGKFIRWQDFVQEIDVSEMIYMWMKCNTHHRPDDDVMHEEKGSCAVLLVQKGSNIQPEA